MSIVWELLKWEDEEADKDKSERILKVAGRIWDKNSMSAAKGLVPVLREVFFEK